MNRTLCRLRWSIAALAVPVIVGAAVSGSSSVAREAVSSQGRQAEAELVPSGKSPTGSAGAYLSIGDRLKITFFELIDIPSDSNAAPKDDAAAASAALRTFYQRMDLSGEYAIDQEGAISVPRLGRLRIQGLGLQELQAQLDDAFARVVGRAAEVNVTIVERAPIYVVGPVKNPGAYKYVPGMFVLQAIALAGGLDQGPGASSQLIENLRETERLRKLSDRKDRLLARRARLEAERTGSGSLKPPAQLIALTNRQGAEEILDIENAILHVEQPRRQQQQVESASAIDAARSEAEVSRTKLAQVSVQRELRIERLNELQQLMSRGLTTRNNLIAARNELSDIEARRQDYSLAVVQAEAKIAQLVQAAVRGELENAASLLKAIATVNEEIADIKQSLASSEVLSSVMEEISAKITPLNATVVPTFGVVRQVRGEPTEIPVKETSALMPGDVLKIIMRSTRTQEDPIVPGRQTRLDGGTGASSPQ